jgi:hypothetical protein
MSNRCSIAMLWQQIRRDTTQSGLREANACCEQLPSSQLGGLFPVAAHQVDMQRTKFQDVDISTLTFDQQLSESCIVHEHPALCVCL